MSAPPRTERELDSALAEPRASTIRALAGAPGDIAVLGAGGKMGPTLALMALRAASEADGATRRRVIAVSRFSSERARRSLEDAGVGTIACDLLDAGAVAALPDVPNVVFMAGQKFGTTDAPSRTWMMNVVAPAICAERYAAARIVAFSTGNVYPLVAVSGGGARETDSRRPSASTPRRASDASACSSTTPPPAVRVLRSCVSITQSICAMGYSRTSPRK